MDVKNVEVKI